MRSTLHQYSYQELRMSSTSGSPSRVRSKWKAVLFSLAMVFGIGLIFVFYSSYDQTASLPPFERKLISRWEEKKTQILKRGDSSSKTSDADDADVGQRDSNVASSSDDNSGSVLQRLPLSK